jgi:hypothetical protein
MYDVLGKCPVWGEELIVTRMHCRNCDVALEGQFSLGRFYRLSPEQLRFIDVFIRSEGKLNKVQEETGLSYPTVRSRLHDVIDALGYEVKKQLGPSPEQRRTILDDVAQGRISSEQAIHPLQGE